MGVFPALISPLLSLSLAHPNVRARALSLFFYSFNAGSLRLTLVFRFPWRGRYLEHEFRADRIYSRSGSILVALNPFKVAQRNQAFFFSRVWSCAPTLSFCAAALSVSPSAMFICPVLLAHPLPSCPTQWMLDKYTSRMVTKYHSGIGDDGSSHIYQEVS